MFDFKNVKIKAVILSFLTYLGVTVILGGLVGIYTSISLMKSGDYNPQDPESMKALQAAMFDDTTYLISTLLLTLIGGLLAGYVAAKSAKIAQITNSLVVGIVLILLGVAFMIFSSTPLPLWLTLTTWVLLLAGLYGGATLGTPSESEQPAA